MLCNLNIKIIVEGGMGKKKKKKGSESWAYWNGYTLYNQKAHQSIMFNKKVEIHTLSRL